MTALEPARQTQMFETSSMPAVPAFEDFWQLYPRRIAKPDAIKMFFRVAPAERHWVLESTPLWVAFWRAEGREQRFIPYPATFIHRGDWREPPPAVPGPEPAGFAGIRALLGGGG